MNKKGVITKVLYSNSGNGVNTLIQAQYNIYTNHIGIYTGFHKSAGWNNGSATNKKCSKYLGETIAETVLVKVFKNVKRMPINNPGLDFTCNYGYMIDVKSATTNKKYNNWLFHINHNYIADYFLCIAFDNRKDLNPLHILLIPSKKIVHLNNLTISQSTFNKWSQYELTDKLDKVISCCNIMKGDN